MSSCSRKPIPKRQRPLSGERFASTRNDGARPKKKNDSDGCSPPSRILREGDLVRVGSRCDRGKKEGELGKIKKVINERHSRKRKRTANFRYTDESSASKKKTESKPKAEIKHKAKPKQRKSTLVSGKTKDEGSKKQNRPSQKENEKVASGDKINTVISIAPTHDANDTFEKHWREFERTFERMEKLDRYDFFQKSQYPAVASESPDTSTAKLAESCEPGTKSISDTNNKPIFFDDLRSDIDNGRYVLDKKKIEFDRISRIYANFGLLSSNLKDDDVKIKLNYEDSIIFHEKSVDWNLFRNDVIKMCDIAYKNCAYGNGTTGTLSYTATKVKEYIVSTSRRIETKQSREMELDVSLLSPRLF